MTEPQRLHEIHIRVDTQSWIRKHIAAAFKPQDVIPSFEQFNNGESEFETSEYEDLLFLPLLAYYLAEFTYLGGPIAITLSEEMKIRTRRARDMQKFHDEGLVFFPCNHLVGLGLDLEDVPDIIAYTLEAAERAERVQQILSQPHPSLEASKLIGSQLSDQEVVDVYIFNLLKREGISSLPRPAWVIEQAEKVMSEVDANWNNGFPAGQSTNTDTTFVEPRELTTPEPEVFVYNVLTDKQTGDYCELIRISLLSRTTFIRSDSSWQEISLGPNLKEEFDVQQVIATPQQRMLLLDFFDSDSDSTIDISVFLRQPGQTAQAPELSVEDLNKVLRAEVIFTDAFGVLCTTSPVGELKPAWPSLESALDKDLGEVWVYRADTILPFESNLCDDDVAYQFFADRMHEVGLQTKEVQVKTTDNEVVPALMIIVEKHQVSHQISTDIMMTLIITGRLGLYHLVGQQLSLETSGAINYQGNRPFQIAMA